MLVPNCFHQSILIFLTQSSLLICGASSFPILFPHLLRSAGCVADVIPGGDDADAKEQVADAAPALTDDDDDDGFGTFETAADGDANVDVEGGKAGDQVEEQSEEQAPVAEVSGDNGAGSDDEWGDFETPGEENVAAAAAVAESEADNVKDQSVPVPVDPDTHGKIRSNPDAAFTYHEDPCHTPPTHELCHWMRTLAYSILPCVRLINAPTT